MTTPNTNESSDGPKSIGVIMDGNRRWARAKGLPTLEGHRAGAKKLEELAEWARERGIKWVIVYAFSTENWKREESEVQNMLHLLDEYLEHGFKKLSKNSNIRFIGDRERFSIVLQEKMSKLEKKFTEGNPTAVIALSYGGRVEILNAVKKYIEAGEKDISEDVFAKYLFTNGIPDPELIIRTGGQQRLSNFLTWQSVYSELIFTNTLWPAYTKEEFEKALETFADRKRNFGI